MQKNELFSNPISRIKKDEVSIFSSEDQNGSAKEDGRGLLSNQLFSPVEESSSFFSHRFSTNNSFFEAKLSQSSPKESQASGSQQVIANQQFFLEGQSQQLNQTSFGFLHSDLYPSETPLLNCQPESYPQYSSSTVISNNTQITPSEKYEKQLAENSTTEQFFSPEVGSTHYNPEQYSWQSNYGDNTTWIYSSDQHSDKIADFTQTGNFDCGMDTSGNFGTNQGLANHLAIIGTQTGGYMTGSTGFIPILQNHPNYFPPGRSGKYADPNVDNRLPPFTLPPHNIANYTENIISNDPKYRSHSTDQTNSNRSFKVQICTITNCEVECPKNDAFSFNQPDCSFQSNNQNLEQVQNRNKAKPELSQEDEFFKVNLNKNTKKSTASETVDNNLLLSKKINNDNFVTKQELSENSRFTENKNNSETVFGVNQYSNLLQEHNFRNENKIKETQSCEENSEQNQLTKENQRLIFRENRQTSVYIDYPGQPTYNDGATNMIAGYDDYVMGNPQYQPQFINYPAMPRHFQQVVGFSRNEEQNKIPGDENLNSNIYQTQLQAPITTLNNHHTLENNEEAWEAQSDTKSRSENSQKYNITPNKTNNPGLPPGIFFQGFPNTSFFTCPPPPQWCNSGITTGELSHGQLKPDNNTHHSTPKTKSYTVGRKTKKGRQGTKHGLLKPYTCSENNCSKRFSKESELRVHINKHHIKMEKPYFCDICNKSFKRPDQLKRHQKIHTGEKPHKCKICGRCFARTDHRNTHLSKHTGEKQTKVCRTPGCNRRFNKIEDLRRHETTSHSEATSSKYSTSSRENDDTGIGDLNTQAECMYPLFNSKTNENHALYLGLKPSQVVEGYNTMNYSQLKPVMQSVMINEPYLTNPDLNQPIVTQGYSGLRGSNLLYRHTNPKNYSTYKYNGSNQ